MENYHIVKVFPSLPRAVLIHIFHAKVWKFGFPQVDPKSIMLKTLLKHKSCKKCIFQALSKYVYEITSCFLLIKIQPSGQDLRNYVQVFSYP